MPVMAATHQNRGWQFWIDCGGTFTDVLGIDPKGAVQVAKLLSSNPNAYSNAVLEGIRRILATAEVAGSGLPRVEEIKLGTTVATNGLLERQGEPTLLATTQGFADGLEIGYQERPDLFALEVRRLAPLYSRVIEVEERVSSQGATLVPLARLHLQEQLRQAFEDGFRAVAVVLLHGYRYPAHEAIVADVAREVGFEQISLSHEVLPLRRWVSRGQATVLDAYLSPLLKDLVREIEHELPGVRLRFMKSSGGLVDAAGFRGRDAVLSGPAGGVVGMALTANRAGFDRVIGFDMGGTSTDVSLYDGEYQRFDEQVVAGVRLRTPMLGIHTVAAGGGSILRFLDGRLQVGPESAGAEPGPACYRKGGPLTLTDANLLLGRVQSSRLPAVFGPTGDQRADDGTVRDQFAELTGQVNRAYGSSSSPEEVAEGFLKIAVERMAQALRRVTLQQGRDPADFVLSSFGGAGGQHACRVADELGIKTIFVHPMSGVLSAFGIGLSTTRSVVRETVGLVLSEENSASLHDRQSELVRKATQSVRASGHRPGIIHQTTRANLRYAGSDATVGVAWAVSISTLAQRFRHAHERLFGFVGAGSVVVEEIEVEAFEPPSSEETEPPLAAAPQRSEEATATASVWRSDAWATQQVLDRRALDPGQHYPGPVTLVAEHETVLVEPGWEASVDDRGGLILRSVAEKTTRIEASSQVDPILLEVFNNLFLYIADQMGTVLQRTAHSVNIKERLDYSCALFDAEGHLVANAPHMPVHLGSMGESVRSVLEQHRSSLEEGDSYLLNAPYAGGTHLPDLTVVTPVFISGQLEFFVASRGHHADIGGITPGSMPANSRTVEEEGILFSGLLVARQGEFLESSVRRQLSSGPWPARDPDQNIADLEAQLAANHFGCEELKRACRRYGAEVIRSYMDFVQKNATEAVREVLGTLEGGFSELVLDNGVKICVSVSVDRTERSAVVDFSGTSEQQPNNFNAPPAVCRAAVLYVFRLLVDRDIPLNAGCLHPVELRVPEGSLLNPRHPAAVVAGNVETSQNVTDLLLAALGKLAASQGTMNNLTFGNERWQYYETICGGTGAGKTFHGETAIHAHMTNSRLTDPEILEDRYPVVVERFTKRLGSGGTGRFAGGDGVIRALRFQEALSTSILSSHRRIAPKGLKGGGDGERGRNSVRRANGNIEALSATATLEVQPGDVLVIETPGGGGFGLCEAGGKSQGGESEGCSGGSLEL